MHSGNILYGNKITSEVGVTKGKEVDVIILMKELFLKQSRPLKIHNYI